MTEEKWLNIYPEMETLIRKALKESGKSADDLPTLMLQIKDILFN